MRGFAVLLRPAARLDRAEAVAWYEAKSSGRSHEFWPAVDATVHRVARFPDACASAAPGLRRG